MDQLSCQIQGSVPVPCGEMSLGYVQQKGQGLHWRRRIPQRRMRVLRQRHHQQRQALHPRTRLRLHFRGRLRLRKGTNNETWQKVKDKKYPHLRKYRNRLRSCESQKTSLRNKQSVLRLPRQRFSFLFKRHGFPAEVPQHFLESVKSSPSEDDCPRFPILWTWFNGTHFHFRNQQNNVLPQFGHQGLGRALQIELRSFNLGIDKGVLTEKRGALRAFTIFLYDQKLFFDFLGFL